MFFYCLVDAQQLENIKVYCSYSVVRIPAAFPPSPTQHKPTSSTSTGNLLSRLARSLSHKSKTKLKEALKPLLQLTLNMIIVFQFQWHYTHIVLV